MNYRLYSFVAHHYLSPLQCGLQTAHVVGELSNLNRIAEGKQKEAYELWAGLDKTIIICGAGNHEGVISCWANMVQYARDLKLPVALFNEDERSMNRMATACGVIVPQQLWDTTYEKDLGKWLYQDRNNGDTACHYYDESSVEGLFISHIKSYRLV